MTFHSEEPEWVRTWKGDQVDTISLHFIPAPPSLPAPLANLDGLRHFFRTQVTEAGGGLIEVETLELDECKVVRTILKIPQKPSGMGYIGALMFPFRDFNYLVRVMCQEFSPTGMREAFVAEKHLQNITTLTDPRELLNGFAQDPYDPTFQSDVLRNLSEDEAYDAQFPGHPLTRVRRWLKQIQDSVKLLDSVKRQPGFGEPPPKVPWWLRKIF